MTTSGVMAAGLQGTGKTGNSAKCTAKTSGDGSFSDMVSASLSSQKESSAEQTKTTSNRAAAKKVQEKPDKIAAEQTKKPEKESLFAKELPEESRPAAEEVKEDSSLQNEKMPAKGEAFDLLFAQNLKMFRNAAKMTETKQLEEWKQSIMDTLEIDEEELADLLEQFGASLQDLLQPQMLTKLVAAVEGNYDSVSLLTNERAANDLRALLAKAEEVSENLDEALAEVLPEEESLMMQQQSGDEAFETYFAEQMAQTQETAGGEVKEAFAMEKAEKLPDTDHAKTGFTFTAVKESSTAQKTQEQSTDDSKAGADAKTQTQTAAEQFLNLVANAAGKEEETFGQLTHVEQVKAAAEQILEKVRVIVGDTQSSMEISLTPESLGKVTLNLVSKQGALTAHFTAESQIAKEAIESQMVVLRENLENQGLKVDAIEVTVSNFDFMHNGSGAAGGSSQENRQRGRRGVTFEDAVHAESITEAEEIAADMMERSGNQVDYTA